MPITVTPTAIPDVLVIETTVFSDDRGWFFESFNEKDFSNAVGEKISFVQDNHSSSKRGVLRGLHYQTEQTQGKLLRVCHGAVFDVAVDLRKSSKTYGSWVGDVLSAQTKTSRWIPPGFAHGFLVLSETAEFLYKTTNYWHAGSEQCIAWNDPTLNIQWPDIGMEPILSPKDAAGLSLNKAHKFFEG
jgi:dTDP-4-dehydrorhamnose 3,5-epimerase